MPNRHFIVNADGIGGTHASLHDAIDDVLVHEEEPWLIELGEGAFHGPFVFPGNRVRLTVRGAGAGKTILTGDRFANQLDARGKKIGTYRTATVYAHGDETTFENLTFANTAGNVGQALALYIGGDRVIVRDCELSGWQDTLYLERGRQYFEKCRIVGHCDYIFGASTAVFQSCEIHSLQANYIVAASTPKGANFGFVFFDCDFTSDTPDPITYLGRPWRWHAKTMLIRCQLGAHIHPEGWHDWKQPDRRATSEYIEFGCTGAGATLDGRADWMKSRDPNELKNLTPERVFAQTSTWCPNRP